MKPIEFPEHNAILAKDQPEYLPLPVFRDEFGLVVSCWRLTFWERIRLLFRGRLWLMQLTFGKPLQPQLPQLESPFETTPDKPREWIEEAETAEETPMHSEEWMMLGAELEELAEDHAEWSQATFGSDQQRGPVGPLKHLEKEAREAAANPSDASEYADCLLLLLDASRRAGITPLELVRAGAAKMTTNKARQWQAPTADAPVEHVRG